MAQTPYLGSKISLISKLDIRYEGILYTVDSNESTIALAKVRSFGTEDRPTDHPVKARDEVYEFIIFKASDIKDLVVCETAKEREEVGGIDYDPAIVSVQSASAPSESSKPTSSSLSKPPSIEKNETESSMKPQASVRPKPEFGSRSQQRSDNYKPNNYNRGNNFNRFNKNVNPKEKLKFDSDYDFEKANENFRVQMESLTADMGNKIVFDADVEERKEKENTAEPAPCYDKSSSFFDDISCESQEKATGRNKRPDWRKERQTNQETFGQYAVRNHGNRGGYHRGGYRGGQRGHNNYHQNRRGSRNTYVQNKENV